MNTTFFRLLLLCTIIFCAVSAPARAQDLGALRARMEKRIAQIDALKTKGALGENNRGLLEVRASAPDADSIAAAENTDRNAVYSALAKQTGASASDVAKARARQIAANSAAGVWLQRDNGEWYKK